MGQDQLDNAWTLTAGFFGSVVSLAFAKKISLATGILSFIGGVSSAFFLAPAITKFLPVSGPTIGNAVSFLMGLLGMEMCRVVIKFVRTKGEGMAERLADKFLPGSAPAGDEGDGDSETGPANGNHSPESPGERGDLPARTAGASHTASEPPADAQGGVV